MKRVVELYGLKLPIAVWEDINKRIMDWIASGGKEEDQYVQRQIEYAEKVHRLMEGK